MDPDLLTVAQVRQLLGDRYARVCGGGACVPLDVNGRVMYFRNFVEQGLRKDLARYPEPRRRAVVTKAARGVPEVVVSREGVHSVVVKAPAPPRLITRELQAEFERLQAAARRFLAARGASW
jgi:hypothetical protein